MNGTNFDLDLLVTLQEINDEARPCTATQELADRCIEEAQLLDIKSDIGDSIYLRLYDKTDDAVQKLWRGCSYQCGSEQRIFAGLRKALLYYAYGRIARASVATVTRFAVSIKRDDYSDAADAKVRQQVYSEAFAIADGYKADAVRFINDSGLFNKCAKITNNRIQSKGIGL